MSSRQDTSFQWDRSLDRDFNKMFDRSTGLRIVGDMSAFEREYRQSETDDDIPDRFKFKPLHHQRGKPATRGQSRPWSLHQIYVGLQAKFRAVVMFTPQREDGWWVWVFKKERDNEPNDIDQAERRARALWERLAAKNSKAPQKGRKGKH